jgi:hypothetical protein
MDSCGAPRRGGDAGGAITVAVEGEAERGRGSLGERFFPASLASDSGSWLLLHVAGVTVVRFHVLVGDNNGWRWPVTWSRATSESEAEQKRRGRGKEKGREPSSARDKGRPGIGSGGDRCLCALRRECGHCAVTDAHGYKPVWATDWWARPSYKFTFKFPIQLNFVNLK